MTTGDEERITWIGPVGDRGGYGGVARNYVRGLQQAGRPPRVVNFAGVHPDLGVRDAALLDLVAPDVSGDEDLVVVHTNPGDLAARIPALRETYDGRIAACTIAETDRLPDEWAAGCALADEVWVPSTFNLLTFGRSGVDPAVMRLVPYGMDPHGLDADGPVDRTVAPDDHTVFLYTFAFDWRKGFDLLLQAYLEEFTRDDATTLVLKVYDPMEREGTIKGRLASSVADAVDLFGGDLPRVVVLDEPLPREQLHALARRADLYVSTDRANGWGMPAMESMTLGRAAATIDWSGSTEFMRSDNALLIPAQPRLTPVDARLQAERPDYRAQHWPEVRVEDVRATLRAAHEREVDLEALGRAAREEILASWTVADSARWILERDSAPYRSPAGLAERLRPLVGLNADGLGDVRGAVIGCEVGPPSPWLAALDAWADAVPPDADVSLYLFASEGASTEDVAMAAAAHLGDRLESVADIVVATVPPEEALVDPRLLAVVTPNDWWPLAVRTAEPTADAFGALAGARTGLPVELPLAS